MTNASEVLVRQPDLEPARAIDGETRAPRRLNHQRALESESIHILREAAAEFARPVMLYSIGKDSSAMLRLAQKAFFPGKIAFPLLHIDTSYKFPEMIEFRDANTRQIGAELIVHKNHSGLDAVRAAQRIGAVSIYSGDALATETKQRLASEIKPLLLDLSRRNENANDEELFRRALALADSLRFAKPQNNQE